MGKEDTDDKPVVLTPHELFCTDFLSKISLICAVLFTIMLMVFINLLSNNSVIPGIVLTVTYTELIVLIFIVLGLIASVFLIIPVVFQMLIYIFEDLPDKKIPIKRGVNRIVLGLSLISIIILMLVLPGIADSNSTGYLLLFFSSLLIDMLCMILKLKINEKIKQKALIPLVIFSGLLVSPVNASIMTLFVIMLTKVLVMFTINFITQFQVVEEGRKKNVFILAFVIILSLHAILLYFLFRDQVNHYIINNGGALVNQLYACMNKIVTENPLKLAKIFSTK